MCLNQSQEGSPEVKNVERVIAVSSSQHNKFGCPYCGFQSGTTPVSGHGEAHWVCGDCGKTSWILMDGITETETKINGYPPVFQEHPRKGTPKHGASDIRPDSGGEFFKSRGIGMDVCSCCVCDANADMSHYLNNIAAFVKCKAAGERVVAMFQKGARLDYREREPDRVQVKVGACDEHMFVIKNLDRLVGKDDTITKRRINLAMKP